MSTKDTYRKAVKNSNLSIQEVFNALRNVLFKDKYSKKDYDIVINSKILKPTAILYSILNEKYLMFVGRYLERLSKSSDPTLILSFLYNKEEVIKFVRRLVKKFKLKPYMMNYKTISNCEFINKKDYYLEKAKHDEMFKRIVLNPMTNLSADDYQFILELLDFEVGGKNKYKEFEAFLEDSLKYLNTKEKSYFSNTDETITTNNETGENAGKNLAFKNYKPASSTIRPHEIEEFRKSMYLALMSKYTNKPLSSKCETCKLRHNKFVNFDYVINDPSRENEIDVMIVGMNPYVDEIKEGRPFVGEAGKILRRVLKDVFDKNKINYAITNTVMCFIPDNKDPDSSMISACSRMLSFQIKRLNPKIIMPLGRIAIERFFNVEKRNKLREIFNMKKSRPISVSTYVNLIFDVFSVNNDRNKKRRILEVLKHYEYNKSKATSSKHILIPAYHPSYLARNRKNKELFDKFKSSFEQALVVLDKINKEKQNKNDKHEVDKLNNISKDIQPIFKPDPQAVITMESVINSLDVIGKEPINKDTRQTDINKNNFNTNNNNIKYLKYHTPIKVMNYEMLRQYAENNYMAMDVFYDHTEDKVIMWLKHAETGERIYLDISNLKYPYYVIADKSKWTVLKSINDLMKVYTNETISTLHFMNSKNIYKLRRFGHYNAHYTIPDRIMLEYREMQNFNENLSPSINKKHGYEILFFDIEVFANFDIFADENQALHPISSISMFSEKSNTLYVFYNKEVFSKSKSNINIDEVKSAALKQYAGLGINNINITIEPVENEIELINKFIYHAHQHDVISAWNIKYDIDYIYNRMQKLNMNVEDLSPVKAISEKRADTYYKIPGLLVLDLYELYKKYGSKHYSYTLNAISEKILSYKKVEYEGSLDKLLLDDANRYLLYSLIDSFLIKKISDKTGILNLALSIKDQASLSHYSIGFETFIINGLLYKYAYKNNMALASSYYERKQTPFPGAFVREPKRGLIHWVVDLDASSMYPSLMITLNISPETFAGKILTDLSTMEKILYTNELDDLYVKIAWFGKGSTKPRIETMSVKKLKKLIYENNKFYIAPNGALYRKDKDGLVSTVLKDLLNQRKAFKSKMLKAIEQKNHSLASYYNTLQLTMKILANAFYGSYGAKEFIYYIPYVAESITIAAQHMNKHVSGLLDKLISHITSNKYKLNIKSIEDLKSIDIISIIKNQIKFGSDTLRYSEGKLKYVFYSDTDSSFIHMEDILVKTIKQIKSKLSLSDIKNDLRNLIIKDKYVKHIDYSKDVKPILYEWVNHFSKFTNEFVLKEFARYLNVKENDENRFYYKTEFLYRSMWSIDKKVYVEYTLEREGKPVNEISSKNIGVKSDYPPLSNDMIKDAMKVIIFSNADLIEINKFIDKWRAIFLNAYKNRDPRACFPISFGKELSEYKTINDSVRAILLYNMLMQKEIIRPKDKAWKVIFKRIDYRKLKLSKTKYAEILKEYAMKYGKKNKKDIDRIAFPIFETKIPDWIIIHEEKMLDAAFVSKLNIIFKPIIKQIRINVKKTATLLDL